MYPRYYNSYMSPKTSLFSKIKRIDWNGFLDRTGKTLGVINQAIPIVNQVKPIMRNASTMFKIMKEVSSSDSTPIEKEIETDVVPKVVSSNKPQFFI